MDAVEPAAQVQRESEPYSLRQLVEYFLWLGTRGAARVYLGWVRGPRAPS